MRSGSPASVGDILASFFKETGYDTVFKEWEAVTGWKQIAGDRISEVTECDRVENGVLYVKVASAAWRQELTYLKDTLLESVRRVTECETIRDIVFY